MLAILVAVFFMVSGFAQEKACEKSQFVIEEKPKKGSNKSGRVGLKSVEGKIQYYEIASAGEGHSDADRMSYIAFSPKACASVLSSTFETTNYLFFDHLTGESTILTDANGFRSSQDGRWLSRFRCSASNELSTYDTCTRLNPIEFFHATGKSRKMVRSFSAEEILRQAPASKLQGRKWSAGTGKELAVEPKAIDEGPLRYKISLSEKRIDDPEQLFSEFAQFELSFCPKGSQIDFCPTPKQ